ncbi:hypothetical protein OPV22_027669 [Ensete ventricosum]|uniref:SBP-type domain-containing protein n=1 Tax=Ensete ventricosum TaxID=4639 RepID=A0AAV8P5K7_ENSVE|nr:hypothetical protein OPV22_027669 [Ensete ventricosum]
MAGCNEQSTSLASERRAAADGEEGAYWRRMLLFPHETVLWSPPSVSSVAINGRDLPCDVMLLRRLCDPCQGLWPACRRAFLCIAHRHRRSRSDTRPQIGRVHLNQLHGVIDCQQLREHQKYIEFQRKTALQAFATGHGRLT